MILQEEQRVALLTPDQLMQDVVVEDHDLATPDVEVRHSPLAPVRRCSGHPERGRGTEAVYRQVVALAVVAVAEGAEQTVRKHPCLYSNQPARLPEEYAGVAQEAP